MSRTLLHEILTSEEYLWGRGCFKASEAKKGIVKDRGKQFLQIIKSYSAFPCVPLFQTPLNLLTTKSVRIEANEIACTLSQCIQYSTLSQCIQYCTLSQCIQYCTLSQCIQYCTLSQCIQYCRVQKNGVPKNGQAGNSSK